MNRQEFIDRLRAALNGRVSPALVAENVNYYEEYINVEIRKGRSEAEVLQTLGDPRLIAKTIITANGKENQREYQGSEYYGEGFQETDYQDKNHPIKSYRLPGWLVGLIIILVLVLFFSLLFSVLSFLAPIIIPIFVVVFLIKLFRDWLN